MEIDFKIVDHGSEEWKKAVELREQILRKPMGLIFSPEELDEEKNHVQIVGLINNEIIATTVLVPERPKMKMQRVVVKDNLRNSALGSKMMSFCESYLMDEGYETVYCHARDSAVNFYLKNGYSGEGDYFDEDGIPHLKMRKNLVQ